MKFYAAIAAVLILCGQLLAQEKIPEPAKEAFAVEVKKFGRPILWLKPKADSNEDLPVKVLTYFLEKVSEGDLENAQKMCYIAGGSSKDERPTVTDNEFKLFISQFQDSELTRIVLSHYAIRGERREYQRRLQDDKRRTSHPAEMAFFSQENQRSLEGRS